MRARSAVLDLYGDHLAPLSPGERAWAPVSGLVTTLEALDLAAPAVRTAVSRLAREGWLERETRAGQRGYAATATLMARVQETRARIYRDPAEAWDGRWHLVVTEHVPGRPGRARLAAGLGFLGYARLRGDTWVAPRPSAELAGLLAAEDIGHTAWHGPLTSAPGSLSPSGPQLAADLWDLPALAAEHEGFLAHARALQEEVAAASPGGRAEELEPAIAFGLRSHLVHRWRKFLFTDPGLPAALLPTPWPGHDSAAAFRSLAQALLPGARAHVEASLDG